MCRGIMILIIGLVLPMVAHAGWVQYHVSTGWITGGPAATDLFPSTPDRASIEDPTLDVANPAWPLPPGCTAGAQRWTQLSPGNVLPLIARTDLVLFSTTSTLLAGCHEVGSWRELRQLYRQTIAQVVVGATDDEAEMIAALNDVQLWVMRRCPESVGSANCITARANLLTMDSEYRGAGQAADLTTQLVTLRNDVLAFKLAQGW